MADEQYFRKDRISCGIGELDIVLEGGYINPGAVLLFGPTSQEKLALSLHFACAGIKSRDKTICIALDMAPEEVERKAAGFGLKLPSDIVFIDCYSSKLGAPESSRQDVIKIPGPEALNDLSLALGDIIKKSEGSRIRVIFHSLSTLSIYNPPETVIKFLQFAEGRLKGASATSIWLVDEGMHDRKFITSLESMADQKIRLSESAGMHEFSCDSLPIPLRLKLGAAGIEVL